jgi:hypothetical protein
MGGHREVIANTLCSFREANVALYAGGRPSHREGRLLIVSVNGKAVTEKELEMYACHYLGGGNTIDGPALEWLAKQPEPRFWVSDGYVTSCEDVTSEELFLDAGRVVCQGNIHWINPDVDKEFTLEGCDLRRYERVRKDAYLKDPNMRDMFC